MRISDWSSDVCSSDLQTAGRCEDGGQATGEQHAAPAARLGFGCRHERCPFRLTTNGITLRPYRSTESSAVVELKQPAFTIGALAIAAAVGVETIRFYQCRGLLREPPRPDRTRFVQGKSVQVRVGIGGRRIQKKKKKK